MLAFFTDWYTQKIPCNVVKLMAPMPSFPLELENLSKIRKKGCTDEGLSICS
jgi:hypothetical protein